MLLDNTSGAYQKVPIWPPRFLKTVAAFFVLSRAGTGTAITKDNGSEGKSQGFFKVFLWPGFCMARKSFYCFNINKIYLSDWI